MLNRSAERDRTAEGQADDVRFRNRKMIEQRGDVVGQGLHLHRTIGVGRAGPETCANLKER